MNRIVVLCSLIDLKPGMKISDISVDISLIYSISVMFDTISAIYSILTIYRRYIGFGPIYSENIRYVVHACISLIFR